MIKWIRCKWCMIRRINSARLPAREVSSAHQSRRTSSLTSCEKRVERRIKRARITLTIQKERNCFFHPISAQPCSHCFLYPILEPCLTGNSPPIRLNTLGLNCSCTRRLNPLRASSPAQRQLRFLPMFSRLPQKSQNQKSITLDTETPNLKINPGYFRTWVLDRTAMWTFPSSKNLTKRIGTCLVLNDTALQGSRIWVLDRKSFLRQFGDADDDGCSKSIPLFALQSFRAACPSGIMSSWQMKKLDKVYCMYACLRM